MTPYLRYMKGIIHVKTLLSCVIVLVLTALLLYYWIDEMVWYFAYHFAFSFDSINYVYNTRPQCTTLGSPSISSHNDSKSQTWDTIIAHHMSSTHNGWILSSHPVTLGLCNRILDITSMFILAIATNRTLWIEWDEQPLVSMNRWEPVAMSGFDQMFESPIRSLNLKPPDEISQQSKIIDKTCFMHHLATSPNLNVDLIQGEAVSLTGCDWSGGLLLRNPHYKNTIFKGLNFSDGFPAIFRLIFNLRPPTPKPVDCNWLIQYRVKRPSPKWVLRPIDDFIDCAISKGMRFSDYRKTWVITDDQNALISHASPQSRRILSMMNLPQEQESCRGPCGDRKAMETMYRLTQCKNAVLSLGSSFGSCITSVAKIQPVYRVGRYGDCHALPSNEPFDMNTVSRYGNTATFIAQMHN
jgi:hypothetical protein